MNWMILVLAGLLEACWAVGLKFTDGFTKPWPSIVVGAAIAGSMVLLSMAMRTLPVATAYAVWVGIGIVGTALAQRLLFREQITPAQWFFLALLTIAIAGLKLSTPKA